MASVNRKAVVEKKATHEGAPAKRISKIAELRRTVLACFLWEDQFYESGVSIADRIQSLVAECTPIEVADLAVEARTQFNLRHVPLLLMVALCKAHAQFPKEGMADYFAAVIQRPDEMGELLSIYWKDGKKPVPNQMRKGLAKAFRKFNEYSLAKYDNAEKAVRIRDVMFIAHPKPETPVQVELYKRIAAQQMVTPDTWETSLSGGADKKETFERLITEGKLGYLALLRNLRNMEQVGCDRSLVIQAIEARKGGAERVFPFRFTAAARHAPSFERSLDTALLKNLKEAKPLKGTTIVLVDVSGSMDSKLSGKSDLTRADAAATLASMIPGDVRVFSFSNTMVEVPARLGIAGVKTILASQPHSGTRLGEAVNAVAGFKHDRLIVITDEQSRSAVPDPVAEKAYMINVASYQNGVGYGKWTHIDGFSERVLDWINEFEAQ